MGLTGREKEKSEHRGARFYNSVLLILNILVADGHETAVGTHKSVSKTAGLSQYRNFRALLTLKKKSKNIL